MHEALLDQSMAKNLGEYSDPENLVPGFMNEIGCEYGNFDNFQKRIENIDVQAKLKRIFLFCNIINCF